MPNLNISLFLQLDEESTDSMVSASPQLAAASQAAAVYQRQDSDSRSPYLIKRKSNTGSLFYQARQSPPVSPVGVTSSSAVINGGGGGGAGAGILGNSSSTGEGLLIPWKTILLL